jgi:hypothetical protein
MCGRATRVLRFKQFRSANGEPLEHTINYWLEKARPDVKFLQQSHGPTGELVISFLYEEGFQATEQRLTQEASAIVEHALAERAGAPLLDPVVVEDDRA